MKDWKEVMEQEEKTVIGYGIGNSHRSGTATTEHETAMIFAAEDIRHLLSRGYPRTGVIRFVSDHYRLENRDRHILMRVVVEPVVAALRIRKRIPCIEIKDKDIMVDGYNVIISTESVISGESVFLCDDGFIRDIRGVFRNYKNPVEGVCRQILEILSECKPDSVTFLFDAQISKSGMLARYIRGLLPKYSLSGDARTSKHVDFDLKHCDMIVATGDGNIIDEVRSAVDIPGRILEKLGKNACTI
ncbi:MAG: DUF434 domain-containing protein [Euryarchaeota archaeon]|nr:DUF434 domain-containing protein [Euryarchaeota archaeon]